jgi:DnaJ family protein C protein 13
MGFRTTSLLAAGSALAHQTVRCSALNVEELRREGGLEALLEAITRCIPMISVSSKPDDVPVQVSYQFRSFNRNKFYFYLIDDIF